MPFVSITYGTDQFPKGTITSLLWHLISHRSDAVLPSKANITWTRYGPLVPLLISQPNIILPRQSLGKSYSSEIMETLRNQFDTKSLGHAEWYQCVNIANLALALT
jgi:hypothetical protein